MNDTKMTHLAPYSLKNNKISLNEIRRRKISSENPRIKAMTHSDRRHDSSSNGSRMRSRLCSKKRVES